MLDKVFLKFLIKFRFAKILNFSIKNPSFYNSYLGIIHKLHNGLRKPDLDSENKVLQSVDEYVDYANYVKELGLFQHPEMSKNWDSLIALNAILKETSNTDLILDAGAEKYSAILPWLHLYNYKRLIGINLTFKKPEKRGNIIYEYGDITKTKFPDEFVDAITCLSVIEHGVDIYKYFSEMSRILKPGGVLITSTDYYESPIDSSNKHAYGHEIKIFDKENIVEALNVADRFGFKLRSEIDYKCYEKPVLWEKYNLKYTFIVFTLQKLLN